MKSILAAFQVRDFLDFLRELDFKLVNSQLQIFILFLNLYIQLWLTLRRMVSQRHGGSGLVGFQNQIFETVSLVVQVDILVIVVLVVIILGI